MYVLVLVTCLFLGTAVCWDQSVTMDSGSCGQEFTLDDDDDVLRVYYHGVSFSDTCKITVTTNDYTKDLCSYAKSFEFNSCAATLEYHQYSYSSFSPDKEYTCSTGQYSEYCTMASTLVISVDKTGSGSFSRSDSFDLKVSLKDSTSSNIIDSVKTGVYVTIGIIVSVVVILIILVVVVIVCCCRRRQNQGGTVYRAPGQGTAVTTTVGYPMANQPQTGYGQPGYQQQPPPAGYQQHPPPAGFQQPPPAGYQQQAPAGYQQPPPAGFQQPPPAGYPPPAQQGYAGFQTGPAPFTDKASAPPMEQPPPYS